MLVQKRLIVSETAHNALGDTTDMAKDLQLTFACGDYEIMRALKEGQVKPDGIELTILTKMDSTTRHWRFLRNAEFDVGELSASSYVIARDQGMPFNAIPVFPHRRFRHGFVFINTKKGIKTPKDLIGKKIGLKSFQVTALLWLRGILEHEYGVPHRSIEWFTELDEDVEFTPPASLKITKLPADKSVDEMLLTGELDALMSPDLYEPITQKNPNVARLFADYRHEEIGYFKKTGIFPIMHVVGIKREIVEKFPWVPIEMYRALEQSKAIAMKRMQNPRIVPLAWYSEHWEEQEEIMGADPWAYGLTEQNRTTFETMVGYSHEQGLIKRRLPLDELFLDIGQGHKRGGFKV